MDNKQKCICLIAILLALIAISMAMSATSTTTGVQWIVNNTNMAPFVAGHGGTGERIGDNTTYWNNATPIEIFLYSHANITGTAAEIHLFINGTKVSDTSGRALGVAEQSNRSIVATIPQYSYYSVEMVNYHHYEWYEYKILTGNVTTNITTSGSGGIGCTGNCSFNVISINGIKNNTSTGINLYSPILNHTGNVLNYLYLNYSNGIGITSTDVSHAPLLGNITAYWQTPDFIELTLYGPITSSYNYTVYGLSMGGRNITNVNNISSTTNLNLLPGNGNYSFNSTDANWNLANLTRVNHTNMSGVLTISGTAPTIPTRASLMDGNGAFKFYNNTTLRTQLSSGGIQEWFLNNGAMDSGYILYTTPAVLLANGTLVGSVGIIFRNETQGERTQIYLNKQKGLSLYSSPSSGGASGVTINQTENFEVDKAGKGITLISPDGHPFCTTVSNAGLLTTVAGYCT